MSNPAIFPRLFDIVGAAAYLSIGKATVRDYLAEGILKTVALPGSRLRKPGGAVTSFSKDHELRKVLIDRADLDQLIDEARANQAARRGAA
jgi:predicted site-specific integrase-resolvase